MEQTSMFAPPPMIRDSVAVNPWEGLRDYQETRAIQVQELFKKHRSVLLLLHCGAGKTRTAGMLCKNYPGRILWLAHRDFLCTQARLELMRLTGRHVDLEKAEWVSGDARIIVGSVQTLKGDRLKRHHPTKFDLVVIDEGHHATALSYRNITNHFATAKVLLLSATPSRADRVGLHNVCESSCDPFGIEEGLAWGSFVPILPASEFIDDIHFDNVKTVAGDLAVGDLEREIAKNAAPIARLAIKHMEGRQTIIYTPGVASAHAVAATIRELGFTAVSVDADTKDNVRTKVLSDFGKNEVQYIVNCGIYTEGLDVPNARGIVIARPTKSESLYIQMAGRGGRPEGHIGRLGTSRERIEAISRSNKPNFKLLDITGHAGRHSLVSSVILAGKDLPEDVKKKAKELIEQGFNGNLSEVAESAAQQLKEEEENNRRRIAKLAAQAEIKSRSSTFDPFKRLGFDQHQHGIEPANAKEPADSQQIEWLKKNRLPSKNVSKGAADALYRQAKEWAQTGKATWRMRRVLADCGLPVDLTFGKAGELVALCGQMGYNRTAVQNSKKVQEVLNRQREPGED